MKIIGIELGSTRIKSVLIDESAEVVASGSYEWENRLENGCWTYSVQDIENGLSKSYEALDTDYAAKFGDHIKKVDAIGVSAMMHGYIALGRDDGLLVPFRTWRNTFTSEAAQILTDKLGFNIPERWSVAHYFQAVRNREPHIKDVAYLTTLAGYVHYRLTGEKVIGLGDASGMFPVSDGGYDKIMLEKTDTLLKKEGVSVKLETLLPKPLSAGQCAGKLTVEGARLLDRKGNLVSGVPLCPPEGDAGTGMTATNSVSPRTANVSAGTSAFLMTVLETPLKGVYREIDVVATPHGLPVAMVHVNNCTNEINAWAELFEQLLTVFSDKKPEHGELMTRLFELSENSFSDIGGLVGYNFLSGEPIAGLKSGAPTFIRTPSGKLTLADFMQMQIYSAVASLRLGTEILEKENVTADEVCGHGGFFKTDRVGQRAMAAALGAPVSVMKNAGEGGAWGMALLALYSTKKNLSFRDFLDSVFLVTEKTTVRPSDADRKKFDGFMKRYKASLNVAKAAAQSAEV